jgi:PEGA domain
VSPEATVRMAPANMPATGGGGLAAASPLRSPSVPSNARPNTADAPVRHVPTLIEEDHGTARKRGSFLLCLVLLGIIGYAGYRIWPQMLDIWQRMHEPGEVLATPARSLPVTPPANPVAPEAKPDDSSQAAPAPPAQKAAPAVAKENPAPARSSASKPPAKLTEAAADAVVEKPNPPQKPVGLSPTLAANSLKSTLESELAGLSLADKVKMEVAGNTLTLSGKLTSREHSKLLALLHNVPGGVRVIDDIGYSDELKGTSGAAEVGWVWVRSMPQGAEIFVDGTDTGLRTPARVEMQPGEHEILLTLDGFGNARRAVSIRRGQNMQFTELLGQP